MNSLPPIVNTAFSFLRPFAYDGQTPPMICKRCDNMTFGPKIKKKILAYFVFSQFLKCPLINFQSTLHQWEKIKVKLSSTRNGLNNNKYKSMGQWRKLKRLYLLVEVISSLLASLIASIYFRLSLYTAWAGVAVRASWAAWLFDR